MKKNTVFVTAFYIFSLAASASEGLPSNGTGTAQERGSISSLHEDPLFKEELFVAAQWYTRYWLFFGALFGAGYGYWYCGPEKINDAIKKTSTMLSNLFFDAYLYVSPLKNERDFFKKAHEEGFISFQQLNQLTADTVMYHKTMITRAKECLALTNITYDMLSMIDDCADVCSYIQKHIDVDLLKNTSFSNAYKALLRYASSNTYVKDKNIPPTSTSLLYEYLTAGYCSIETLTTYHNTDLMDVLDLAKKYLTTNFTTTPSLSVIEFLAKHSDRTMLSKKDQEWVSNREAYIVKTPTNSPVKQVKKQNKKSSALGESKK